MGDSREFDALANALAFLPPRERVVAIGVLHMGHAYREVGEWIGVSSGTVRKAAFTARKKLQASLGPIQRPASMSTKPPRSLPGSEHTHTHREREREREVWESERGSKHDLDA
jgi:hypothetical protein